MTLSTFDNFTVQSEQPAGLHVAIIMDGNGRWAARRNLPRVAGHRAGVAAVRRIVEHAPDVGIGRLTVYAFSSDNWRRPAAEVQSIFWLLRAFLRLERARLRQAGARLEVIGRRDRIPKLLLREIDQAESCDRRRHGGFCCGLPSITLRAMPSCALLLAYPAAFRMSGHLELHCCETCLLRSWPQRAARWTC